MTYANPCPHCTATYPTQRGLSIHLAQRHGVASANEKTLANRQAARLPPAAARSQHATQTAPAGPVGLLLAVITLARADALHDPRAAAWLADVRSGIGGRAA